MTDRARWNGEIGYFDSGGARTGRELFSVSVHDNGATTLRAQCEMDDDALVRDAILVLRPDDGPAQAFVRIVESGRPAGSAWYRFRDGLVEADIDLGADPPQRESRSFATPARFFGTHSLVNDGWLARLAPELRAGESVDLFDLVASSLAANGGGPPGIFVTAASVAFVGVAEIEVQAGRFACRHYRVRYGGYPPLDMWLTGPVHLLVKMDWSHLGGRYELLSLRGGAVAPAS